MRRLAVPAALLLLGACTNEAPEPEAEATEIPEELAGDAPVVAAGDGIGTPMAERVAVLGLLNKRNGLVRELEMKPGESVRVGRAIVRMRACEMTAPWEDPPETGAFVQLTVQDQRDDKWRRVFSGWIFRERPERNVIEHPIYDVFVKSCAMTYPGGEPVERSAPKAGSAAPKASSAPQSPATNGGEGTATPAAPAAPAAAPAPAPVAPPKVAAPSPPANTE